MSGLCFSFRDNTVNTQASFSHRQLLLWSHPSILQKISALESNKYRTETSKGVGHMDTGNQVAAGTHSFYCRAENGMGCCRPKWFKRLQRTDKGPFNAVLLTVGCYFLVLSYLQYNEEHLLQRQCALSRTFIVLNLILQEEAIHTFFTFYSHFCFLQPMVKYTVLTAA